MRTYAQNPKATQQTTSATSKIPGRAHLGQSHEVNSSVHMQRTIRNQLASTAAGGFAHDFSQIPIRTKSPVSIQAKLTIGQPNDKYEQEADRVADQVMRMPENAVVRGQAPAVRANNENLIQRQTLEGLDEEEEELVSSDYDKEKGVNTKEPEEYFPILESVDTRDADELGEEEEEEEELLLPKSNTGMAPQVTPGLTRDIHSIKGTGQPLPASERAFFEPRFGRDFSHVRVHTNNRAARAAQSINARAFTLGHDVVFGAGQYSTGTISSRRLLAHELTHVVQQHSGIVSPQVQRAKINYRQLTWADFKGSVPAASEFLAVTSSGFSLPTWNASGRYTRTGRSCRTRKRRTRIYSVRFWINPARFNRIKAVMDQSKSWARSAYKTPVKYCTGVVSKCSAYFTTSLAKVATMCQSRIKDCQDAFNKRRFKYYTIPVDGKIIRIDNLSDCATKLVKDCTKIQQKKLKYEIKWNNIIVSSAISKSQCTGKRFKNNCVAHFKKWEKLILKHEQGHFDISNVLAGKARADMKKESQKYTATASGCGKKIARRKALRKFRKLKAVKKLRARFRLWKRLKTKASDDYDKDTDHALKQKAQKTWEAKIKAGLKTYTVKTP